MNEENLSAGKAEKKLDWKHLGITTAIILVTAGVTFGATWYVLDKSMNEQNEASDKLRVELQNQITALDKKLTATPTPTPSLSDANSNLKTYTIASLKLSFKYPSGWTVREDTSTKSVYLANKSGSYDKSNTPANYQLLWFSYNPDETSSTVESRLQDGSYTAAYVATKAIPTTVALANTTGRLYEFKTTGDNSMVFFANSSGTRFTFRNGTEFPAQNAAAATVKNLISTITVN